MYLQDRVCLNHTFVSSSIHVTCGAFGHTKSLVARNNCTHSRKSKSRTSYHELLNLSPRIIEVRKQSCVDKKKVCFLIGALQINNGIGPHGSHLGPIR